ncbi:helix-turn-helix domain-containing protein [Mycoplana rhizolycopersici]|uniref:Helix-turn-helix transcriptional regulator n=1 Tax=Mycoplana rhizolycopersici TaxID=2746702 RepID=A0ABX2QNJ2_9HYPH|nr:helix-turn-helix transcriptional regulator [Rhizobium rhizolycopersici]NVP58143.1 helix-turn-helix transcriptional regulator [Rhizobium rhizolycopersici]
MAISPSQCRAARALIEWTAERLAKAARLSDRTIVDFERGGKAPPSASLSAIEKALLVAGVEMISEDSAGPGVRLRQGGNEEQTEASMETGGRSNRAGERIR